MAELLGVAAGCVCSIAGVGVPIAVAVAIFVALILMVPLGTTSPLGWLAAAISYVRNTTLELPTPIDEGTGFGVSWSGLECAAVVSIVPKPALTILSRRGAEPGERLPLAALAKALRQHDIALAGIDVVSHSQREQTRPASVLRQLIGPLAAVPNRTVWVVVRLDARTEAVERRGGGRPGATAALATATNRIVDALARHDIEARILSAAEISTLADTVLGAGEIRNGWTAVTLGDQTDTGFTAKEPDPALIDQGWTIPSAATTTLLALRPAATDGRVEVAMSWRFTGAGTVTLAARRADGCQLQHLRAHLPVAANDESSLSFEELLIDDLARYPLATGGCGQLVGATADGKAVAVGLCAPSTRVAALVGSAMFLRQTIFRGIASGARIVVRTDRPDMWEPLVKGVGNRAQLRVIALGQPVPSGYDVLVADGDLQGAGSDITTIFAAATPAGFDGMAADVAIVATGTAITVTAGGQSIDVDLVTVAAEQEFVGGSNDVRIS